MLSFCNIPNVRKGNNKIIPFKVLDLTWLGIKPKSTVLAANQGVDHPIGRPFKHCIWSIFLTFYSDSIQKLYPKLLFSHKFTLQLLKSFLLLWVLVLLGRFKMERKMKECTLNTYNFASGFKFFDELTLS